MGRQRSEYPSYCRHKGTGLAYVTLGGYLGKYGSSESRQAYDRLLAEWLAAGRPSRPLERNDLTIAEICIRYWEHAKSYYHSLDKTAGELHPIKAVIKILRTTYGTTSAVNFGPLALRALRE